ncbi:Kelch_1 domain-containing protein/Dev_Cell_Death domain-containing protein [Cephalotus follicularis]|uniref:Kelch_1 domain-containing protein/Dev_Cell_Death domain-containing protein n=1 Tax=Cephalotus follicularis TaxID=3775 RepID=A0A1Q3B339_CEPFO|nr:Kelch_1 domain-containing protein/Dev_Cell_Death domain-containing protein [Cephalotus follicularis]
MGRGRKTQTFNFKEKSQPAWTVNCSGPARNLGKNDLGGVIFGCKHNTIKECFDKQLFGLPATHFSYVRNITPGLPLFLFNYSDRKLHGIFKAAGHGQLNIDPCGWTEGGSDYTPYAAQVKIQLHLQCQPLLEDKFSTLISDNYYEPRLFYFELDKVQTRKLMSSFQSSPITATTSLPKSETNWTTLTRAMPTNARQEGGNIKASTSGSNVANRDQADLEQEHGFFWDDYRMGKASQRLETSVDDEEAGKDEHLSFSSFVRSNTAVAQKMWSSLFKDGNASGAEKEVGVSKESALEVNVPHSDWSNMECESSSFASNLDKNLQLLEPPYNEDFGEYDERLVSFNPNGDVLYSSGVTKKGKLTMESSSLCVSPCLEEDSQPVLAPTNAIELLEEHHISALTRKFILMAANEKECCSRMNLETVSVTAVRPIDAEDWEAEEFESINEKPDINGSMFIVGGFDGSSWLSSVDLYVPSKDLMRSLSSPSVVHPHASAAKLNGEIYVFGGADGNMWYDTVESYHPQTNQWASRPPLNKKKGSLAGVSLTDKIFAVGGGNGIECFSEVEMFDLDVGRWIPVRSMLQKRFAPGAAEINGTVYVAGGYDGKDYLKSIERFDPREHSWTRLESMASKRGCLSLAVLNEKLYAIGGFDGERIVSTVEVFDPRVGSWMMGESMTDSRGNFGAGVIGNAIYVVGGIKDDYKILDTVECFMEGRGWRMTDLKAVGERCFFSALV